MRCEKMALWSFIFCRFLSPWDSALMTQMMQGLSCVIWLCTARFGRKSFAVLHSSPTPEEGMRSGMGSCARFRRCCCSSSFHQQWPRCTLGTRSEAASACVLRAAKAPDWVLLALLLWRSKAPIPGYGRLSFEAASSWLDQAAGQNGKTLTAAGLPGIAPPVADEVPNALPPSSHDYLEKRGRSALGKPI